MQVQAMPLVSFDPATQARYESMRQSGESHRMAEVLATRSFPGVRTDSTFNEGRCNGNQFETMPLVGDYYRSRAEKAGVSTTGKFYMAALADEPGDPKAWVSDRHDVLRVAREKGMRVSGSVEYEPGDFGSREPTPSIAVAPEIIEAEADDIMEAEPGQRRGDVIEKLTQLRTGAVDLNPFRVSDYEEDAFYEGIE